MLAPLLHFGSSPAERVGKPQYWRLRRRPFDKTQCFPPMTQKSAFCRMRIQDRADLPLGSHRAED
jgi:hypothetical protein